MVESKFQFSSSLDGLTLNGTIATPSIGGALNRGHVLLLGGSGKIDRDETIPAEHTLTEKPEKLFKQISDALVLEGFTTFRYDKRGIRGSTGDIDRSLWATADRVHLISDAVDASLCFCKNQGIEPSELTILGHSEGTIIGVECAIRLGSKVKGLILLGAVARSFRELIEYQLVSSPERPDENRNATLEDVESEISKILNTQDIFHPDDDKPFAYHRQMLAAPANSERIVLVSAPVAIFQGRNDFITPADEIERFRKDGLTVHTAHVYDGLGHAFSADLNGRPTLGPIESYVLNDIVAVATAFTESL